MSAVGDRNVLERRRAEADAPACPVCGRPLMARGLVIKSNTARWIRAPACSTTCLETLRQQQGRTS